MNPRIIRSATALATTLTLAASGIVAAARADSSGAASEPPAQFAPRGVSTDRFPTASNPAPVSGDCHDATASIIPPGACTSVQIAGACPEASAGSTVADVDPANPASCPPDQRTALIARVYRPDTSSDPQWRTPVILDDGPYFEGAFFDAEYQGGADLANQLVDYFTPKGYTVVKLDLRGTGRSGGCFDSWGPSSAVDYKLAVQWFADQSWTNGRVGTWGGSADATSQDAGAVLQPRGLATVVTMNPMSSFYDGKAFDGVPYDGVAVNGGSYYGAGMFATDAPDASPQEKAQESVTRTECGWGKDFGYTQEPYLDESEDPYFQARDWRPEVGKIKASVLYYGAFQDATNLPVAFDGWYDDLHTFKRAIFSQLTHEPPFPSALTTANLQYLRGDWWDIFHAWFDTWLLGLDTKVGNWPAVQVQDEHNAWRGVRSFADLGSDETVPLGVPAVGPSTQGEPTTEPWSAAGVNPACADTLGTAPGSTPTATFTEPEQLCWQTSPGVSPLHLSGEPHLVLPVTLNTNDARFMFDLDEVNANGTVRYLTRGYLAASRRTCETCSGATTSASLVPPNQQLTYDPRSIPLDVWLDAGSSLRLVISGLDPTDVPDTGKVGDPLFRGIPEGNGFSATIDLVHATLQLPIANPGQALTVAPPAPTSCTLPAPAPCS